MVEIRPQETALLVVDLQNGMCHPRGTLGLSGVDTTELEAIVPRIERLVGMCRAAGIPDIWSKQIHYPDDRGRDSHRIMPHTRKRMRLACEAGTWDAEIVGELARLITPETHVIEKHKWGMFYGTRLEPLLRILGANLLVVCGTTTNACVDTTVREAYMRDFDVVVVEDCVAGVDELWHRCALEVWRHYVGEVVPLAEIEGALAGQEVAT